MPSDKMLWSSGRFMDGRQSSPEAGRLGLIVTALNLLPIGQLDGGHISHALFGSRYARSISMVAMVSLFLLALFVWPGLMFWAFIVFL
jgi:membrane-associated protease RseP (regulator of RpoE activity)